MARAFIIMLDSFGVGATPDAHRYGDEGADTLRHIAEYCASDHANVPGLRHGPLNLPNLCSLGLEKVGRLANPLPLPGLMSPPHIRAAYGSAKELSLGKDTQSGHWEMAGVPVLFEWGYFPPAYPSFPEPLLAALIQQAKLPGILGNRHASGTQIIDEWGEEHERSGKPIVYTSADSVFQIAAHELSFGLDRLYAVCEVARGLVDQYNIGRVIARPFLGTAGRYYRTGHRRDYATLPPAPTLLGQLVAAGGTVTAIGKVADIYAHQGITHSVKVAGNVNLCEAFLQEAIKAPDHSITFVNLVDFDMEFGHRRNVAGYAAALESSDRWLPEFERILQPQDMAIMTADHGCDPTWPGSDHTREHVPVIAFGPSVRGGAIGVRDTFADIGQSIASHLGLAPLRYGKSFLI